MAVLRDGSHGQCFSDRSMKGDVKRKSSPWTGESEVLVSASSPCWFPLPRWWARVFVLARAVRVDRGERRGGDREGIVSS